ASGGVPARASRRLVAAPGRPAPPGLLPRAGRPAHGPRRRRGPAALAAPQDGLHLADELPAALCVLGDQRQDAGPPLVGHLGPEQGDRHKDRGEGVVDVVRDRAEALVAVGERPVPAPDLLVWNRSFHGLPSNPGPAGGDAPPP